MPLPKFIHRRTGGSRKGKKTADELNEVIQSQQCACNNNNKSPRDKSEQSKTAKDEDNSGTSSDYVSQLASLELEVGACCSEGQAISSAEIESENPSIECSPPKDIMKSRSATVGAGSADEVDQKKRSESESALQGMRGERDVLLFNEKDFRNIVGLYADKLIRQSIAAAVNISRFCEVADEPSHREFSDSVSEYVEMHNLEERERGSLDSEDEPQKEESAEVEDPVDPQVEEEITLSSEVEVDPQVEVTLTPEAEGVQKNDLDTIAGMVESMLSAVEQRSEGENFAYETDLITDDPKPNLEDLGVPANVEEKKVNWKCGYLHVKLPHKTRGKGRHLKAWKKRCVAMQADEFVNDDKNPSLMINVYSSDSGTSRKHSALFWKAVSSQKAAVFRCVSKTQKHAFTISENNVAVIHLAAESETACQDWMAAIRAILWPPSPVVQLEKMLNGNEFEIALIDNEFSYRAGLLGAYGYLTITPRKLILLHPQMGYVIQEWYLNTVDKFQLIHQSKIVDVHKVLSMTTCSDSSTGKGEILIYCSEAVAMLQAIACTIHKVLQCHSKDDDGKYKKELEELTCWMPPNEEEDSKVEEFYDTPKQIRSLLDIPNFIFEKPTAVGVAPAKPSLTSSTTCISTFSQDSGISEGLPVDDFLNCSVTSFVIGGGSFPGKSSDSEDALSDTYTPPRTPDTQRKVVI